MRLTFICRNPGCALHDRKRTVTLLHLGQSLYSLGPVICVCGSRAEIASRTVNLPVEAGPVVGRVPTDAVNLAELESE